MDDALAVLQAAVDRSKTGPQTGAEVRLALRTLRFVGVPADTIRYFWDACATEHDIGRSQNMSAALNRIRTILRERQQAGQR